jgi:hypothetical protein
MALQTILDELLKLNCLWSQFKVCENVLQIGIDLELIWKDSQARQDS